MNKVVLIGRLTRDIELKYTPSNIAVRQFTLAVNRNFKNADGNYDSDFINCVVYRKQAETLAQYSKKGDLIAIEGRIQTGSYDDKDGNKRFKTDVIVENFNFLTSKKKDETTEQVTPQVENSSDPYAELGDQVSLDDFLE